MMARALTQAIEELAFTRHKIGLVSGPRQCGKTTLAKMLLQRRETGLWPQRPKGCPTSRHPAPAKEVAHGVLAILTGPFRLAMRADTGSWRSVPLSKGLLTWTPR